MSNVKTAISLQKALFEELEALAHEMNISRSRVLALALEDFIRRHQNRQLLEQLNVAYDDAPDAAERELQRAMRRPHRRIVENEW